MLVSVARILCTCTTLAVVLWSKVEEFNENFGMHIDYDHFGSPVTTTPGPRNVTFGESILHHKNRNGFVKAIAGSEKHWNEVMLKCMRETPTELHFVKDSDRKKRSIDQTLPCGRGRNGGRNGGGNGGNNPNPNPLPPNPQDPNNPGNVDTGLLSARQQSGSRGSRSGQGSRTGQGSRSGRSGGQTNGGRSNTRTGRSAGSEMKYHGDVVAPEYSMTLTANQCEINKCVVKYFGVVDENGKFDLDLLKVQIKKKAVDEVMRKKNTLVFKLCLNNYKLLSDKFMKKKMLKEDGAPDQCVENEMIIRCVDYFLQKY